MVFSSVVFLFFYLPVVLLLYRVTPLKWRNLTLLIANLIFYAWGEPIYILIMFLSIIIDYTHGLLVEKYRDNDRKARSIVIRSVIFNLGLLIFFKYFDFIMSNINLVFGTNLPILGLSLPLGISFYTFQTMSYTIDVYRGDAKAQRNIITFGTFVTLFPQLIAGPIIKYKDLDDQLRSREENAEKFASGVQLFIIGLAKKVLLANNIGKLWDIYSAADVSSLTVLGGWLGLIAFAFQIYFDFSGYSDMARGLGRMFGFEFKINFDHPYISASVTEFWRRWHMSLTGWFRDYVYIPLGGNRCSKAAWLRNILIVWALTGIWHGASWNFLVWGLYFAVLMIAEKLFLQRLFDKLPAFVSHLYTIVAVLVGWGFFAIDGMPQALDYLKVCFGLGGAAMYDGSFLYYLASYLPMLVIMAAASTSLGTMAWQKLSDKAKKIVLPILLILALLSCTAYLVDATYNPFLYFRF